MTACANPVPPFPIDAGAARYEAAACADGIMQILRLARALIASGRVMCLDGLDAHIAGLCARCLGLQPDDAGGLCLYLLAIRAELDAIALIFNIREQPVLCPSTTS